MKSLKRGLCAALAVMLSLSFAACGDRKPNIIGGVETSDKITILTTAAVTLPRPRTIPISSTSRTNTGSMPP